MRSDAAEDAAADPEVKPTTEEADGDVIEILVPPKKDTELPHPDSPVDIRRWMVGALPIVIPSLRPLSPAANTHC